MPPCDDLSVFCRALFPGKSSHGKATTSHAMSLTIPWLNGARPLDLMTSAMYVLNHGSTIPVYVNTFLSMRSLHMVGPDRTREPALSYSNIPTIPRYELYVRRGERRFSHV